MAEEHCNLIHAYQNTAFYQVPATPLHHRVPFVLSMGPDWLQWAHSPQTEYCMRIIKSLLENKYLGILSCKARPVSLARVPWHTCCLQ